MHIREKDKLCFFKENDIIEKYAIENKKKERSISIND